MFTAIIVDDEKNGAESLNMLITEYCPELSVKAVAYSINDAITIIKQHKPQLVFLDIEMPIGNGFEILDRTTDYQYKVIFTTAHRQYALEALKIQAIDYLLKPINIDELVAAVNKATLQINNTSEKSDLRALLHVMGNQAKTSLRKISVPTSDGFIFLEIENIVRLEADSNYTHLFCSNKNKITTSKTLKEFETILDSVQFFRTHQSHIINMNSVERYVKGDGGYVILHDGSTIPISRSKKIPFLAFFAQKAT